MQPLLSEEEFLEQILQQRDRQMEARRRRDRRYRGLPEPTRPVPETCECCGGPPGKKSLGLDHDHRTGAFRGWLCVRCNVAIGQLGDSLAGLAKAQAYLEIAEQAAQVRGARVA